MNNYNGKIVLYNDSKFISKLPSRSDYISEPINEIDDRKPIKFLPISLFDQHIKDGTQLKYKLMLVGVLINGQKASVIINDIEPFFDCQIPNDIKPNEFKQTIIDIFNNNNLYPTRYELIKGYPFKYFTENKINFLRIYFNTFHMRKKSMTFIHDNKFEYCNKSNEVKKKYIKTASDDATCYYRKAAREYKLKLCEWINIKNYSIDTDHFKSNMISYAFSVSINDIHNIKAHTNKDLSMVCVWDLETESIFSPGTVPSATNVFKDGTDIEADVIRMASIKYYWYWSNKPLVTINITDMICPSRPDCLTILCDNQTEIIKTIFILFERMSPDYYAGFNDGIYDWPFVIERVQKFDLTDFMLSKTSILNVNDEFLLIGPKNEHIKLEADSYADNLVLDVPGVICCDVRTIFRQLQCYSKSEKSNLDYYLSENKLPPKLDINHTVMGKIFKASRLLRSKFKCNSYNKLIKILDMCLNKFGGDYILLNGKNPTYSMKETINELVALLDQTSKVVDYCNVDSKSCQELLLAQSIIIDRRETSNLSYTSMRDSIFRAGGMKVKNLVMSEGITDKWNILFSTYIDEELEHGKKLPGAYVIPPKKGLYRDDKHIKATRKPTIEKCNDNNNKTDRPCSGLDAQSLYPSLMMEHNFSPEKLVVDEKKKEYLESQVDKFGNPYKFIEVNFYYGYPDQTDEEKQHIIGWFCQSTRVKKPGFPDEYLGMGLYPYILKQLKDNRALIKKDFALYGETREIINTIPKNIETIKVQKQLVMDKINSINNKNISSLLDKIYFNVDITLANLLEELSFQYTYLNVKQNALKTFMNTFYGETGNINSAFFIPHVAGGTTTYGQKTIKMVKKIVEDEGCDIKYGDSVTADTPILCKRQDQSFTYKTIDELAHKWVEVDYGIDENGIKIIKEHADCDEPLKVWSSNGWTDIKKVIRHKTDKDIYRVLTHTGCVDVTEDHSLLDENEEKIKPNNCQIGTKLLHRYLPEPKENNPYYGLISEKEAWPMGLFVADGSCGKYKYPSGVKYSWAINNQNLDYLKIAKQRLEEIYVDKKFKILETMESSNVYKLIPIGGLKDITLKYRNLFYNKENYKRIPDEIINASKEVRKLFTDGYYAGDGDKDQSQKINRFDNKGKIGSAGLFYLNYIDNNDVSVNYRFKPQPKLGGISDIYRITISDKQGRSKQRKDANAIKKIEKLRKTDQYVYDLETDNHTFSAGVGQMIVHNTDSLYPSPPEYIFEQIDNDYENKVITKEEFWTLMILETMKYLTLLKNKVNLILDQGNGFLKMDYEEVLFPYAFIGKKKYIGIQHKNIVNLNACLSSCTLQDFMSSNSLFVRGLETIKRGSSLFLKIVCYDIMKKAFCIDNNDTLKELVESKLRNIVNSKWDHNMFIKSAKYKSVKVKNVSVNTFVSRMSLIKENNPNIGINPPDAGERFDYVVVKRYPWVYDLRGRKRNVQVGEKYEYPSSLSNEKYIDLVGDLEIDLDYYVMNEVIGQLARLIIYHPDYDKFFTEYMYLDDEAYGKADNNAHDDAKRKLQEYYKENFACRYESKGDIYKKIFSVANDQLSSIHNVRYGNRAELFRITNTLTTSSKTSEKDDEDDEDFNAGINFTDVKFKKNIEDMILKNVIKKAESLPDYTDLIFKEILNKDIKPFDLRRYYITDESSMCKLKLNYVNKLRLKLMKSLNNILPDFQKICVSNNLILDKITNVIKQNSSVDKFVVNYDLINEIIEQSSQLTDHEHHVMNELYSIYNQLITVYKVEHNCKIIKNKINYLIESKFNAKAIPPGLKDKTRKQNDKEAFEKFLEQSGNWN